MPVHTVEQDIHDGRLKVLSIEDVPAEGVPLPMSAVYPAASPPGPAGRWLIDFLKVYPHGVEAPRGEIVVVDP